MKTQNRMNYWRRRVTKPSMVGFLDELATNMVEERKGRRKKKIHGG
jgi:hypothetical protein